MDAPVGGTKPRTAYMTVAVQVADAVDLDELWRAGCPYVKLLPAKLVLDREAIIKAVREGRQADLPAGITFVVYGGYDANVRQEPKEVAA